MFNRMDVREKKEADTCYRKDLCEEITADKNNAALGKQEAIERAIDRLAWQVSSLEGTIAGIAGGESKAGERKLQFEMPLSELLDVLPGIMDSLSLRACDALTHLVDALYVRAVDTPGRKSDDDGSLLATKGRSRSDVD